MEPMLDQLSTTGQQDEQRIKQQDERLLENWQVQAKALVAYRGSNSGRPRLN
jgi:hypothetical protein